MGYISPKRGRDPAARAQLLLLLRNFFLGPKQWKAEESKQRGKTSADSILILSLFYFFLEAIVLYIEGPM